MKVLFETLPDESKVWLYQSASRLTKEQIETINELSEVFLSQWESHGIPVQGSINVSNDLFIRIAAFTDEPSMCGRAQDAQVRLAKELEAELGVELTNRMNFAFSIDGEDKIVHMNDVENFVKSGEITPETMYYNNLVVSKKEFNENWKVKASDTWLSRYF